MYVRILVYGGKARVFLTYLLAREKKNEQTFSSPDMATVECQDRMWVLQVNNSVENL